MKQHRLRTSIVCCLLLLCRYTKAAFAFHATSIPPLLDVPVYSLSTHGDPSSSTRTSSNQVARSTMNILTYATPVSSSPHRMWCISLYKGTLSNENFIRESRGVLQVLGPEHFRSISSGDDALRRKGEGGDLIRLLGGSSGRDVNKSELCANLGYQWESLPRDDEANEKEHAAWPQVLPSCLFYLKLELVGDLIDCGSHEVALCRVVAMLSGVDANDIELVFLSTRELRRESIISELGRVI